MTIKDAVGSYPMSEKEYLDNHLDQSTYLRTQDIVSYVFKEFKVEYIVSAIYDILKEGRLS